MSHEIPRDPEAIAYTRVVASVNQLVYPNDPELTLHGLRFELDRIQCGTRLGEISEGLVNRTLAYINQLIEEYEGKIADGSNSQRPSI